MKAIVPIILIVIAVGLFGLYIDPTYESIKVLRAEEAQFDDALDRSKELIAIRDQLLSRYNTFGSDDLERLEKLLPDNIDNVRLIIDINSIAAQYGMALRDVLVKSSEDTEGQNGNERIVITDESNTFSSIDLSFTVSSSYDNFVQFIADLEQSLRIVDLSSLTFEATDDDFSDYEVTVKTYWLQ